MTTLRDNHAEFVRGIYCMGHWQMSLKGEKNILWLQMCLKALTAFKVKSFCDINPFFFCQETKKYVKKWCILIYKYGANKEEDLTLA